MLHLCESSGNPHDISLLTRLVFTLVLPLVPHTGEFAVARMAVVLQEAGLAGGGEVQLTRVQRLRTL